MNVAWRTLLCFALFAAPGRAPAAQELPPIGIIDFYGLRRVSPEQVRAALGIAEGDSVRPEAVAGAMRRLRALPGVARAEVDINCCEAGRSLIYVGVAERGAPAPSFRGAPRGAVRLPDEIVAAVAAFDSVFMGAVLRGHAGEDRSQGHALMEDSAAGTAQRRFIALAARHLPRLREVLRHAGDAHQRAIAAQVIAYAADKRAVVPDLVRAMGDPSSSVRNNATRALILIANLAQRRPELGIRIPTETPIELLESVVWSDRNKASWLLVELTASRDPALLTALRRRALPSLVDIARWRSPGHAQAGLIILGRIAGWPDERIAQALERAADREELIREVQRLQGLRD
jgi:hypothetical protein